MSLATRPDAGPFPTTQLPADGIVRPVAGSAVEGGDVLASTTGLLTARLASNQYGTVAFGEEKAGGTVDRARSDGERELGKRSCEPMARINVGGKFVVAAVNRLDKGMADADHPY